MSNPIRQAIVTKFLGPTNSRGSRIKAAASAGSLIVNWDHALNIDENHAKAAEAFARKFGWTGHWHGGGMPNGTGNVFVCSSDSTFLIVPPEAEALVRAV